MIRSFIAVQLAAVAIFACTFGQQANAQLYVGGNNNNTVGEYNPSTGTAMNSNFITGLVNPRGLLVSGNRLYVANADANNGYVSVYNATTGAIISDHFISSLNSTSLAILGNTLFVANGNGNSVGMYDATTGGVLNANFITSGLSRPISLSLSGNQLYVGNYNAGFGGASVGVYNATTGAAINSTLVTGLFSLLGMTVSGNNLFVSNGSASSISEYNASNGAAINTSFITTGLNTPEGLTVSGGNLFVANFGNGTIGEFNAATGAAVNTSFISGLNIPTSVAFGAVGAGVPEPSTWAILGVGTWGLLAWSRLRRRA